jgi:hypothetical protein
MTNKRNDYYQSSLFAICYDSTSGVSIKNPGVEHSYPDKDEFDFVAYIHHSSKSEVLKHVESVRLGRERAIRATNDSDFCIGMSINLTNNIHAYVSSEFYNEVKSGRAEEACLSLALSCSFDRKRKDANCSSIVNPFYYLEDSKYDYYIYREDAKAFYSFMDGTDCFSKLIGTSLVGSLDTSSECLTAFVVSVAPPRGIFILLEGNKDAAFSILGNNLRNWRNVALSFSTNFTVNVNMSVAIPVSVCHTDNLDNYVDYSDYYSLIAADTKMPVCGHAVYGKKLPSDISNGIYVLNCVRYLSNLMYHSLEADVMSSKNEDYFGGTRSSERRFVNLLGGVSTTTISNLLSLMDHPTEQEKARFSHTKLPTESSITLHTIYCDTVNYSYENKVGSSVVAKLTGMFIVCSVVARVMYRAITRSGISEYYGVTKESLSKGLLDRGQMRARIIKQFAESGEEFNAWVNEICSGEKLERIPKVKVKRCRTLHSFFSKQEYTTLLRGWIFNEVSAQKIFCPEYCLQFYKYFPTLSSDFLVSDKKFDVPKIDSSLVSLGTSSSKGGTENLWYLALMLLSEMLNNNGNLQLDSAHVSRVLKDTKGYGAGLISLEQIVNMCSDSIVLSDDRGDNILSLKLSPLAGNNLMGWPFSTADNVGIDSASCSALDSFTLVPEVWTKEFLSEVKLGIMTGDDTDTLYKLTVRLLANRLTKFSRSVLSYGVSVLHVKSPYYSGLSNVPDSNMLIKLSYLQNITRSYNEYEAITDEPGYGYGDSTILGGLLVVLDRDPATDSNSENILRKFEISHAYGRDTQSYVLTISMLRLMYNLPVEDYIDSKSVAEGMVTILKYFRPTIERYKLLSGYPTKILPMLDTCIDKLNNFINI